MGISSPSMHVWRYYYSANLIGLNHKEASEYFKFGRCHIDNAVDYQIRRL